MRLPNRLDGSICGTILSARPAVVAVAAGANLTPRRVHVQETRKNHTYAHAPKRKNHRASSCPKTWLWIRATFQLSCPVTQTRRVSSSRRRANEAEVAAAVSSIDIPKTPYTKEELLRLVDQEGAGPVDEYIQFYRDPYLRRYAQPDGPKVRVSDRSQDILYPSPEQATGGDPHLKQMSDRLMAALQTRRRRPDKPRASLDEIYQLYRKLPEPRMLRISARLRWRLLRALGTPGRRDTKSMLRYFAVMTDVKSAGLTLRLQEWNFALSFASRFVRKTTEIEVEAAVKLWSEMEKLAGIKGNEVTFNILFDAASKAGNFTLAEMVYKEMEDRALTFNRYHHVSLIHFFGLKQDGDGVRAAYREMVDAGELIDTVVMNCVMSGFIMSGEALAAEEVYQRMKAATQERPNTPPRDYFSNKVMNKVLMMYGRLGKKYPTMRKGFQEAAYIAPDIQTYRIFIKHFGLEAGNLSKVAEYLDEMSRFSVPLHGGIHVLLFRAFALHGGYVGTAWSEERLRGVFTALIRAVDDGVPGLYIDVGLAIWAIRAFKKCGSDAAARDVYDQMLERMQLSTAQKAFLEEFLYDVLRDKDAEVYRRRTWYEHVRLNHAEKRRVTS